MGALGRIANQTLSYDTGPGVLIQSPFTPSLEPLCLISQTHPPIEVNNTNIAQILEFIFVVSIYIYIRIKNVCRRGIFFVKAESFSWYVFSSAEHFVERPLLTELGM